MNKGNAGQGRQKGTPNKTTKALKDMILGALDDAGGQTYLAQQAAENPKAFLSLVGRVLPVDVKAEMNGEMAINVTIKKYELGTTE